MPKKAKRRPFIANDITDINSRPKDAIFDWSVCIDTNYDSLSVAIYDKLSKGDHKDANTKTRPEKNNNSIPSKDNKQQEDTTYKSVDQFQGLDACVYHRRVKKIGNFSNRKCVKLSKPEFVLLLTTNTQNKYKNI
jgi:hypothetical protein